jgi:hypothetical protein
MTTDVRKRGNLWMLSMGQAVEKVEASLQSTWPTFEFIAASAGRYQPGITVFWSREPDAPTAVTVLERAAAALVWNCDLDGNRFRLMCDHVYPLGSLLAALIEEWATGRHSSNDGEPVTHSLRKSPASYRFDDLDANAARFAHAICQLADVTKQGYVRAHAKKELTFVRDRIVRTLSESGEAVASAVGYDPARTTAP